MAARGESFDRLDASILVRALPTPINAKILKLAIWAALFAVLAGPFYLLLSLAPLRGGAVVYVVSFAIFYSYDRYDVSRNVRAIDRSRWFKLRKQLFASDQARGSETGAAGVRPGQLASSRAEYDSNRSNLPKSERNRATSRYLFLIARYTVNGNQQALGFANGDSASRHPTTPMLVQSSPIGRTLSRRPQEHDALVARALEQVIVTLVDDHRPMTTVRELLAAMTFPIEEGLAIRAIEAAELWGLALINSATADIRSQILPLVESRDREALLAAEVHLTGAGLVWHQATHAMDAERRKRQLIMSGGKDNSVHFTGSHIGAPVTIAGRDIRGTRIAHTQVGQPADSDILIHLRTLLASDKVDWLNPQFAAVRPAVEQAVTTSDVHNSRLVTAMRFLLESSGSVLVEASGGLTTQGLQAFFR